MIDSNRWTHVGCFGFSHIYAKGDKRRLVDPKTGQITWRYRIKGEPYMTQNTFEMAEMHKEQYCIGKLSLVRQIHGFQGIGERKEFS